MRGARGERGQILAVVALALVALLGVAAFSIDVGYAYYAKRQLQSATDAAALAGAQDLPTVTTAKATAATYATANTPANLSTVTYTYTTSCTTAATAGFGCNAATNPNNLTVTATASTNTWFAKLFGIGHFDVAARANACSPCSSSPVDVVVVLDRTGSMCLDSSNNANCSDMNNAKEGVHTLLNRGFCLIRERSEGVIFSLVLAGARQRDAHAVENAEGGGRGVGRETRGRRRRC